MCNAYGLHNRFCHAGSKSHLRVLWICDNVEICSRPQKTENMVHERLDLPHAL